MAIFPNLILEDIVQVNDKTRLDATKSFISTGEAAVTLVRIKPETSGSFVTVGSPSTAANWYLDWQFSTAGTKTVTCEITTTGSPTTFTKDITVLSVADDNLFSDDSQLTSLEHDIMKFVPTGRNSFKNFHRKAQNLILAWLDENGHTDTSGARLTKDAIVNLEEVKYWSAALTLSLIFQSISNDPNDIFSEKAKKYESMAVTHRKRLILRIDTDGDGTVETNEGIRVKSLEMIRR